MNGFARRAVKKKIEDEEDPIRDHIIHFFYFFIRLFSPPKVRSSPEKTRSGPPLQSFFPRIGTKGKMFFPIPLWLRFFCRAIYGEAERPNSSNLDVRDGSPQQVEETLDFFAEPKMARRKKREKNT